MVGNQRISSLRNAWAVVCAFELSHGGHGLLEATQDWLASRRSPLLSTGMLKA